VEKAEKTHNLIEGCDLLMHGVINTSNASQMSPDESKLLLMDLLKLNDPQFTQSQIPRLSGLVCGFVTGTAQHLWANEEEFAALGDKVTIRSLGPLDVNTALGTKKFAVVLRICQVDGLTRNDQKKSFVKWEIVDSNNNNDIIEYGITTRHKDNSAEPNWEDTLWPIWLKDFDQLKKLTLRISVQRYRKIQISNLREYK
jgi:hypothetical protein